MELFDKAAKKVMEVGNNVASVAVNVGNTIGNVTKEQTELASLKIQKSTIDKKLDKMYAEIGRRYLSHTEQCDTDNIFDVSDIVENMKEDLEKIGSLNEQILNMENQIKQNNDDREKNKAQEQFRTEKLKLDKALSMDVLTQEEYQEKLEIAQKKVDNFDLLRKIDMQYEMNIISKDEYNEKLKQALQ